MKLLLALALAALAAPKPVAKPKLTNKIEGPYHGCTDAQRTAIEEALPEAARRVWKAKEIKAGLSPFGDPAVIEKRRERSLKLAEKLMSIKDEEEFGITLSAMYAYLGPPRFDPRCAAADDPKCSGRNGYVIRYKPTVHLCPDFFSGGRESRVRALVHESAHVAGVAESDGEKYCPVFDCDSCGTKDTADAWSQWVHCASGQAPDKPLEITAGP